MGDSTAKKIESSHSPKGKMGQKYLASGKYVSLRLWSEKPGDDKPETQRDYETAGFVIQGQAELILEDQRLKLKEGDSWIVPKGARHAYHIVQDFVAVEATAPPAEVHGRDE